VHNSNVAHQLMSGCFFISGRNFVLVFVSYNLMVGVFAGSN
jgi:hypothetical protein